MILNNLTKYFAVSLQTCGSSCVCVSVCACAVTPIFLSYFPHWKSKMKKLRMAIVEGYKNGKVPSRPEMRVMRNDKQGWLILERVVPPVKKRSSKVYFLKTSWDKPNAWNTWTLLSMDDWSFLIVLELERPLAVIRVTPCFTDEPAEAWKGSNALSAATQLVC